MAISPQEWEDRREALELAKLKAAADKKYAAEQQAMSNTITASSLFPDEWKINSINSNAIAGISTAGINQYSKIAQQQATDYVYPMEGETMLVEFTLGRRSSRIYYSNVTYVDDVEHAVSIYGERVRDPLLMLQASCPSSPDMVNKIEGTGSVRRLKDDTLYMRIVL